MTRKFAMRPAALLAAGAALLSGPALAQSANGPATTSICLDVAGHQLPVTCQLSQASRVSRQEDICQCLSGGTRVTVPICPRGVRPPAESAAYERERYRMVHNGSLVGASWQGRPVCVAPSSTPKPR